MTMGWYVLLIAILLMVVLPGCRWLFSRLVMGSRIISLCKEKGYALHKKKGWLFGCRYGKRADFAVETKKDVFAVKLWGVPQRLATLLLHPEGKYSLRRVFSMLLQVKIPLDSSLVSFPAYDFQAFPTDERKPIHAVLLIHPAPLSIRLRDREGKERDLCCGEEYQGMTIMNLNDLKATL